MTTMIVDKIRKLALFKRFKKRSAYEKVSSSQALEMQRQIRRGEPSKIILFGRHSYSLYNIEIKSWGEGAHLFIGSFCSIAGNLRVYLGGNHRIEWATTYPFGHIYHDIFPSGESSGQGHPSSNGHVIINNDVWIGDNCTIMSGIKIGSGSIVASNTVVVKDVNPYTIVGGNPGRTIRQRFPAELSARLLDIRWWEWEDSAVNAAIPILQQPLSPETISLLEKIRDTYC